jgi:hypothetical protein
MARDPTLYPKKSPQTQPTLCTQPLLFSLSFSQPIPCMMFQPPSFASLEPSQDDQKHIPFRPFVT